MVKCNEIGVGAAHVTRPHSMAPPSIHVARARKLRNALGENEKGERAPLPCMGMQFVSARARIWCRTWCVPSHARHQAYRCPARSLWSVPFGISTDASVCILRCDLIDRRFPVRNTGCLSSQVARCVTVNSLYVSEPHTVLGTIKDLVIVVYVTQS